MIFVNVPSKGSGVKTLIAICVALSAFILPCKVDARDALEPVSELMEYWGEPQYNGTRFPALDVTGAETTRMANVIIPTELKGQQLCLSVNAADDWYTAEQTFKVADDWDGGVAGTMIASNYNAAPRDIYSVPAEAGLTRFAVGTCGKLGSDLTLLLSAWREVPDGANLSLYVLAYRGERVAARLVGQDIAVHCREDAEASGRYTHQCDFDIAELAPGRHRVEVVVFGVRIIDGTEVETPERRDFLTILVGSAVEP